MALKCTFGNNYKCCEDDGGYDNDAHLVTYPKEVKFSPLSLCLSVNRTTQKLFIIQIFMELLYIIQRPIRLYSEWPWSKVKVTTAEKVQIVFFLS